MRRLALIAMAIAGCADALSTSTARLALSDGPDIPQADYIAESDTAEGIVGTWVWVTAPGPNGTPDDPQPVTGHTMVTAELGRIYGDPGPFILAIDPGDSTVYSCTPALWRASSQRLEGAAGWPDGYRPDPMAHAVQFAAVPEFASPTDCGW